MAKQTPEQMAQTMLANMGEKTGKPLGDWLQLLGGTSLGKHGEIVKHLKTDHGVTHGFANLIAREHLAAGKAPAGGDDLVDQQYSGRKAGLRPIYDRLAAVVRGFGADVDIAPKKSYVSLRRNKQFALVQPSTATRVDVGINLKGVAPGPRLEASGSFNAMVSHRVRLGSADDVDAELEHWLKSAYEAA